jgi:uncharacterized protein YjbI with pentapeptide repeats
MSGHDHRLQRAKDNGAPDKNETSTTQADSPSSERSLSPFDFRGIRQAPPWAINAICVALLLAILLLLFLTVTSFFRLTLDLLGSDTARSSEAIRSLLPITAAAIGLPLIIWRLVILNRQTSILSQQTRISESKTQIDRETHYTNIFSKSVEQLGQTREVKETLHKEGGVETLTRTVANIEVRLGAIHSLTRLAEESLRDQIKIENMLFSYIRENSWTNKDGTRVERPKRETPFHYNWSRGFREGAPSDDHKANAQKSEVAAQQIKEADAAWSETLAETRVDVNEAIDATTEARKNIEAQKPKIFRDSLFVKRTIKSTLLENSTFEQCVFCDCAFSIENISGVIFRRCVFIYCTFNADKSKFSIGESYLTATSFGGFGNSEITIEDSGLIDSNFWSIYETSVTFLDSSLDDCWISGKRNSDNTLILHRSSLLKCQLSRLKLTPASKFRDSAFANTRFANIDFSESEIATPENLITATASPNTLLPAAISRPESWPAYDENYTERSS